MKKTWYPASMVVVALAVGGCFGGEVGQDVGTRSLPVVYEADDRADVFAHPNAELRSLAKASIVALMRPDALVHGSGNELAVSAPSLGDVYLVGGAYSLCDGERFADQPAAAGCSGTLIDDDLVLTAGHCVQDQADCENWRFVFDYYMASENELEHIDRQDVFGCKRLVTRALEADGSLDYAVVQLDRRATDSGRRPVEVRRGGSAMSAGESVTIIGFGSMIPAKIDDGGRVLDPREAALDYFTATTDSFGGNSGSGVFDAQMRLAGVLVRGDLDYVRDGACARVNVLPPTGGARGGEDVAYVQRALDGLCGSDRPSEKLCDIAPTCGDGLCAGGESETSCAADCGSAGTDVPAEWLCDAGYHGDGAVCDCGCGALDPDCAIAPEQVAGCGANETCGAGGVCVASTEPVPEPFVHNHGSCSAAPGTRVNGLFAVLAALALACWRRRGAKAPR